MYRKVGAFFRKSLLLFFILAFTLGVLLTVTSNKAIEATSTNEFCAKCHVHPHVFDSWKAGGHYQTRSGLRVNCVDCHLPPHGQGYLKEKIRLGAKDIYGLIMKDSAEFNWEARRTVEIAQHFTYQESCVKCHENLFPLTLTKKGQDAHLYYTQNEKAKGLLCLNCHIDVGHYDPNRIHDTNTGFGAKTDASKVLFTEPAKVENFESYVETIPNSTVSFTMKAIPGGAFKMGSPDNEQLRRPDEGPVREVKVSPFFMAEIEVTWDEFLVFYKATSGEGRSTDTEGTRTLADVDAVSGPTPPYGQPDQNWGMGTRPAITMSYHAAETYCKWLSNVTGKNYRLPTEAEWEYAARGGTQTPYFFAGNPKDFGKPGFVGKLFGSENTEINKYVTYQPNSQGKTQLPEKNEANPFGLKNMLGNAAEYCSDWYAADAYKQLTDGITDPRGPETGEERVIRGGAFKSDAGSVRSAARDYSQFEAWLKTDPQMPKSKWWLSDCNHISFRVVCDFNENTGNK